MRGNSCSLAGFRKSLAGHPFFVLAGIPGKNCRADRQKILTKYLKKLSFCTFSAPDRKACPVIGWSAAFLVRA